MELFFCEELHTVLPENFILEYQPDIQDFTCQATTYRCRQFRLGTAFVSLDGFDNIYTALYRTRGWSGMDFTYLVFADEPIENVEFEDPDQDELMEDLCRYRFRFLIPEPKQLPRLGAQHLDRALVDIQHHYVSQSPTALSWDVDDLESMESYSPL